MISYEQFTLIIDYISKLPKKQFVCLPQKLESDKIHTVMNKRAIIFFSIILILPLITFFVIKLARGYKPDLRNGKFKPTGLLVATSEPRGAQVLVNGHLTSATNTTVSLSPGTYEVKIQKDGYIPWQKSLKIEKELVTETNAFLFPSVPNLQPLTYNGAQNPLLSPNGQRVAFVVPNASTKDKNGLYVLDFSPSPLTFNRDARQILSSKTGLDLSDATYLWSPDSKQIFLKYKNQSFLLDVDRSVTLNQLTNISSNLNQIFDSWQKELDLENQQKIKKLPEPLKKIIIDEATNIQWSPDETKIMYTSQKNETLPNVNINTYPSNFLQPEKRDIKANEVYVYNLKEDQNFYIMNNPEKPPGEAKESQDKNQMPNFLSSEPKALSWFPTSRHLLLVQKDKVVIIEYDGTNNAVVFANSFENGFAYSSPDGSKIVILTSLNQEANIPPNLYALSLK